MRKLLQKLFEDLQRTRAVAERTLHDITCAEQRPIAKLAGLLFSEHFFKCRHSFGRPAEKREQLTGTQPCVIHQQGGGILAHHPLELDQCLGVLALRLQEIAAYKRSEGVRNAAVLLQKDLQADCIVRKITINASDQSAE